MKQADLAAHQASYALLEAQIDKALKARDFVKVFAACIECFPHIVPTINFFRQAGDDPTSSEPLCFKIICKYGPPLFEHAAIDSLLGFIKTTRLLARPENGYIEMAEAARVREQVARRIWNCIEQHHDYLQCNLGRDNGCEQQVAAGLVDMWERLGIISKKSVRNTYVLSFTSNLNDEVDGMCPECGARGRGHKDAFFKPTVCKRCGVTGYYHLASLNDCDGER